ncbi:hypothetical protein T484DRAFT_1786635, partial [Baffinella frigidus]
MPPAWLADGVADEIGRRRQEMGSPTMTMDDVVARKIQGGHHLVIGGMVFDVSSFLKDHPGGQHVLLRNQGHDATTGFLRAHGASAHSSLVKLFCADIVDPPAPTKKSLPAKLEVRGDTSLFGRSGGDSSIQPPPFPGVSSVDLQRALAEQSPLAGVSMLSLPPQNTTLSLLAMGSLGHTTTPLSPMARSRSPITRREHIGGDLAGPLLPSQVGGMPTPISDLPPRTSGGAESPPLTSSVGPHGAHPPEGSAASCPFMMMAQLAESGNTPKSSTGASAFSSPHAPAFFAPARAPSLGGSFRAGSAAGSRAAGGSHHGDARAEGSKGGSASRSASRPGSKVASRQGDGSFRGGGSTLPSTLGSSRPSTAGGLKGVGGTYHTRTRRKERTKDSGTPETDAAQWVQVAEVIRASWEVVLSKASFEDIGVYIYDKITSQETLEPLFSFADKASQGRKFVDMLNSLMANIDSPASIHAKM